MKVVLTLLGAAVIVTLLWSFYAAARECEARGGAYVQAVGRYECVTRR
jgi:hypothetical protein